MDEHFLNAGLEPSTELKIRLGMHSSNKYSLSTYCVLGSGDKAGKKTDKIPVLMLLTLWWRKGTIIT